MKTYAPAQTKQTRSAEQSNSTKRTPNQLAYVDNRPETVAQRKFVEAINNSPCITVQRQKLESLLGTPAQRMEAEELPQGKSEIVQRVEETAKPNNTGLPDSLKSGIESLSGLSMDNVKVHYNSSQPAQLNALAYAQGTDIHVAPGQEQHVPHEAWHVVQQAQGRVKPTMQMMGRVLVNDDKGLEREADIMGEKALKDGGAGVAQRVGEAGDIGKVRLNFLTSGPVIRQLAPAYSSANRVVQLARNITTGNIRYETEDFEYDKSEKKKRERVIKIEIRGRNKKDGTDPDIPASFYNYDAGECDDMEGYHRGHVAPRQYGGIYSDYNIVPMLPNFNTGTWKNVENEFDNYIGKNVVTISPKYEDDDDERVPSSMGVAIAGVKAFNVPHDVAEQDGFSEEDMDLIKKESNNVGNRKSALKFLAEANSKGWIPDNYANSPYLPLDIMWLNGVRGEGNPGARLGFKSWQIDWLIQYNRALNGGKILSDAWVEDTTELHGYLYEAGRLSRPEADHIVPNLSGGSNLFTNARLVSWELNNSIERNVHASKKHLRW
jgi:hypothetical protein